jgi:hypothetical protein
MYALGDLDHMNQIISNCGSEWLSAAHQPQFDRLVGEIRARLRPSDPFKIPEFQEPMAWEKAWNIYERLRKRATQESHSPAAVEARAASARFAAAEGIWNRYTGERSELAQAIRRSGFKVQDLLVCIGLEPSDLDEPADPTVPGGRRENWNAVAGRISDALHRFKKMSAADKASVPFCAMAMRGDAAAARLAQVEAYLTEFLTKLEERVSTLELTMLAKAEARPEKEMVQ